MNIEDLGRPGEIEGEWGTEIYDESYMIAIRPLSLYAYMEVDKDDLSIGDMLCLIQGLQRAIEILKEREEKYNANNS